MSNNNFNSVLSSYIDALYPIIYINHFNFKVIDDVVAEIANGAKVAEFSNALGRIDFNSKSPLQECDLVHFLETVRDEGYSNNTFILLKDVHDNLNDPKVVSLLKRISEDILYRDGYNATIFIVSSKLVIPPELENYITVVDMPLPNSGEILSIVNSFAEELEIDVDKEVVDELTLSFKGLNRFQIRQILNLAYQDGGSIVREDAKLILKEKEQFIKKSGMLEIVNFKETVDDIGGLDNLKDWLEKKSRVFKDLDKAIKFGVDIPKGIMIIGMPGCGKSLTAKATASLFEIPLLRLDVGRLLGKYIGESEENMRKALNLAEAISPCVLWVDEIEKAFAGVGGQGGGSDITTRLFGQFLTWIQEKDNTVFIVATANSIKNIPPEFLRKGRFDELFFVDLPNAEERKQILRIHLKKRDKWNRDIDVNKLVKMTEGYGGADLEAVVKETVENAFLDGKKDITTDIVETVLKETKSITDTLKEKIDEIKQAVEKMDIKSATQIKTETVA